jgi:hypothetical protein
VKQPLTAAVHLRTRLRTPCGRQPGPGFGGGAGSGDAVSRTRRPSHQFERLEVGGEKAQASHPGGHFPPGQEKILDDRKIDARQREQARWSGLQ